MKDKKPIAGILSLVTLVMAFCVGVFSTMAIASHTEEMASIGAIAGIGFGFLASIPSFTLAIIGMMRDEKPFWPAVVGTILSIVPAGIGIWMLAHFILPQR